jgi:Putative beta-barrel porin 2
VFSKLTQRSVLILFTSFASGLWAASSGSPKTATAVSALSLSVKEAYDSNVFATDRNPTLASAPKLADVGSWVSTVSPTLAFNFLPAAGADTTLTALNFSYAGDYAFYHSTSTETNQRHTFAQQIAGKSGNGSFSIENSFIYVDGRQSAPQYGTYSAYGTAIARERRNQIQDRTKFVLRYEFESWYLGAVANVLYYDLNTPFHQSAGALLGWVNWVDREDLNFGFDLGYKVSKIVSLWAGYRRGQQKQQQLPWDLHHNESVYDRVLIGAKGTLAPWLKVDLQIGPDIRTYTDAPNLNILGSDHTWLYTENTITADLSKDDSLSFTNKIWHWVSSSGVTSYRDTSYALTLKHNFSSVLSGTVGARVQGSDYDLPALREDWLYGYTLGLRYNITKKSGLTLDYMRSLAKNRLSKITYPGREFSQNGVSIGLRVAY